VASERPHSRGSSAYSGEESSGRGASRPCREGRWLDGRPTNLVPPITSAFGFALIAEALPHQPAHQRRRTPIKKWPDR
jgi:hypothetical protein